ncbi:MAG: hypothetical protein N3A72_08350 [bacterium]|nr:hypothetical protein [bacterium]
MAGTNTSTPPRLGDLLLRYNLISREQLAAALEEQKTTKKRLGAILIDRQIVSEDAVNYVLSEQLQLPYVQLSPDMVDPAVISLIPVEVLEKYQAVPLLKVNDELTMVMVDPTDQEAITVFVVQTGCKIKPAIGLSSAIRNVIEVVFKKNGGRHRAKKQPIHQFDFEQREVFQAALDLADQILKITNGFPAELQRTLGDEMRAAVVTLLTYTAQNDDQAAQNQIRKYIPLLLLAKKHQLIDESIFTELRNRCLTIYNQLESSTISGIAMV